MAASVSKAQRMLESFAAGNDEPELWKLWIALPDGLDEALVSKAFEEALKSPHAARAVGRGLNPSYLDAFLAALEQKRWPESIAASALDGDSPKKRAQQLSELFRMLGQLGVFSMSRSQERERVRAFSRDRVFIEAARRLVVSAVEWEENRSWMPSSLITALMHDASPESMDALLPVVDRAVKGGGDLDMLRRALGEVKDPKPALDPLRVMLEQSAVGRDGPKVRVALAKMLGWAAPPKELKFSWVDRAMRGRVWRLEIVLRVDCDKDPHFEVTVRDPAHHCSVFDSRGGVENALELPVLEKLLDWPKWLSSVKRRMKQVTWQHEMLRSVPRAAAARGSLERWLAG
ncbi:MAG: hypothetical protein QM723_22710 [Myxococcaceae bacterium]